MKYHSPKYVELKVLDTQLFGEKLKSFGFDFYSGVPCSFLKDLINYAINDCDYVPASNEGEAVSIASGGSLGGRKSVALMQNSGLTNATSPLTSLNYTFELPILGFVSWRGQTGVKDEPQHELMGRITWPMLELMNVHTILLAQDMGVAVEQLKVADKWYQEGKTVFFIVQKDTFAPVKLKPAAQQGQSLDESLPTRWQAIQAICTLRDKKTAFLATTGMTGRELYEVADVANNLYMVGSMGCISSLGLGLAVAKPDHRIVAIDGDGSLLMRMGSLAANAYRKPKNLLHIVLDNGVHDSTGGQKTVSRQCQVADIARACGYPVAYSPKTLSEFEQTLVQWHKNPEQMAFVHFQIKKGSREDVGRPKVTPPEVKVRFKEFIGATQ